MQYTGIDTVARISATQASILATEGIRFVGRYLVPDGMGKELTETEAKHLHEAGLGIALIWETGAKRAREGADAGRRDGYAAYSLAKSLGVPDGTAIYYAVDYDAPKSDYAAIEQYLYAAKAASVPYLCGVYGKEDLINAVKADRYMQCVAWSAGVSPKTNIYQYQWQGGPEALAMQAKIGVAVDMDRCDNLTEAGLWFPVVPKEEPWYKEHMDWAQQMGLMNDGRPNDPITRAEVAAVLHRFYGAIQDLK